MRLGRDGSMLCNSHRCSTKVLALLGLLVALLCEPLHAAPKLKLHRFRFYFGVLPATYEETATNDSTEASETKTGLSMLGTQFALAVTWNAFELDLSWTRYVPSGVDYWQNRSDLNVTVGYYFKKFPYITPTIGFFQMSQVGNGKDPTAPPAFILANNALSFGLGAEWIPIAIKKKHCPIIIAKTSYLTTGQSGRNYGAEQQAGLGYTYLSKGKSYTGLALVYDEKTYMAQEENREAPGTNLTVDSKVTGYSIQFYLRK